MIKTNKQEQTATNTKTLNKKTKNKTKQKRQQQKHTTNKKTKNTKNTKHIIIKTIKSLKHHVFFWFFIFGRTQTGGTPGRAHARAVARAVARADGRPNGRPGRRTAGDRIFLDVCAMRWTTNASAYAWHAATGQAQCVRQKPAARRSHAGARKGRQRMDTNRFSSRTTYPYLQIQFFPHRASLLQKLKYPLCEESMKNLI